MAKSRKIKVSAYIDHGILAPPSPPSRRSEQVVDFVKRNVE